MLNSARTAPNTMIEFDVQHALATTYSGLGAAFVVLALLILFILAVRLAIRLRDRTPSPAVTLPPYPTLSAAEPGPVPPSVAAVTELQEDGLILPVEETNNGTDTNGPNGTDEAEPLGDWKIYGRLDAFSSRRVERRSG